MAGRGGTNGLLAQEKLEVLWGSRGNPREWALRRGELVDIQKVITDLRKSVESLKTALKEIKDDIDVINGQILVIEGRLDAAEQAINDMEDALDALDTRIDDAEAALTQLESDLSSIGTDLTDLTNRVTQLELGLPSLTVTADLNTAVRNKEFQWSNTSTNTPLAGSYGRGWTVASSANDLTQFGVVNSTGQTFVRYRTGGTWGAWVDLISLRAEPYALQSNPGTTPFPAAAYTAIPFFTSTELSGGLVKAGNSTFTVPQAGLYQFELEVRIAGGGTSMPPVGTVIGLSLDSATVPTSLRSGYSAASAVTATTIIRLICTERLAAGAQRVAYIQNQGAAAYQVTSSVLKITRLSA